MVPGEDTGISVTVPGLNGGAPIEKTGLTIGTGSGEIEMYRGVSTDTPTLDLANGDVIFEDSGGSLSVTYKAADGQQQIVTGLSYDALHAVTQSNSDTAAANQIIVRNISQALHLQIENITLDRNGPAISIEAGCAVELQTKGNNTVASSSDTEPAVYVDPTATLTLSGDGTLIANYTGTDFQFVAVIGGKNASNSGKIIIRSGTVNVPAASHTRQGAGIGGGHKGTGDVEIHGGIVTANSYSGSGIGGGNQGAGDVKIYGGTVTAEGSFGAGIGGGRMGVGSVKIFGGTVTAKSSNGAGIGSGYSAAGGTVTITGGSIRASSVSDPTNGSESVSLVTITLPDGAVPAGTPLTSAEGYGVHDVYPLDDNKFYFYLPANTLPETITVGGVDYETQSAGNPNYVVAFHVEFSGYSLTKVYDGASMGLPTTDQVTSDGKDLAFAWYQNGTAMASAPVNIGNYTLRVSSSDKGSKDFDVTIKKRPLTITAQAQTIDYGGSIAQDVYTSSGLAAMDTLTVTLAASEAAAGTHTGVITISFAQVTRNGADMMENYTITKNAGALTIRKAVLTVNSCPTASEITYGQALSASVLTGGSASIDGQFGWKDSSITPEKAGTHSYTVTFTPEDTNYDTVSQDISVTVNQAPLAITANKQGITYGAAVETGVGQVTASGLVNDVTLTAVTVSAAAAKAGTYEGGITVTGAKIENGSTDMTANYAISYAAGTLIINKASLSIDSATVASKPYDGSDTVAVTGVTFTGLVNGETLALGTDYTATGKFDSVSAGTGKNVTVTVTFSDTAKANNYQLSSSTCTATGTITKADPVVTAVSVSTPATIYESASLDSITLTHGADDTAGTVALDAGQTLTVGTKGYAWTFTPDDTNNYNTATGTISLTVAVDALQSIAITNTPNKITYTYGESFDKTGMVITATYASGATKVVTGEVQISPAELTVTTTDLTITYQGKTVIQAITVGPKEVTNPTIRLSPDTFAYDGTEKKPAVTVKDGEKMIPADEYTVEYSNNTNVGTIATVTITDKTGGNYTVSGTKTFTITAKPLTGAKVEVTGTFTYTGSAQKPTPTVTLDGKPLVKDTDYTVAYTDNTNAGTAKITITGTGNYSGTAQGTFTIGKADLTVDGAGTASGTYGAKLSELTVSGLTAKLGATEISGTWKLTGDAVPNVGDSGEYTATFTPDSGAGNYNALTAKVKLDIAKANYSGTKTASTSAKFGATGTCNLSALLPDGATAGTAATTGDIFEGTPAVSGKTLTYKLAANATVGNSGTITVSVTSANYNDFNLTITVKVTDKDVPTLTISPITVTYTGEAVPASAIQGTAKVGSTTVPGTWAFASGEAVTNVADSGTKTVKFVPTDQDTYAEATGTVVVTINKATPTGAPKYTAISASGKTLADAGLTAEGGTFSTEGTVAWALGTDTAVTANTQYEWTFTPNDTANYNTLTGKITLWPYTTPVNPGGGGGYVPSDPGGSGTSTLPVTTTGQGSSTVTTTTTAAPTASTQGGTATTTINTTMGNEIVRQAVANNSETVVIAPSVTGSVTKAEVSIPASTVGQIGSRTNASLTVSTPVADVTIPNGGLGSLSSAGGTVTVTAEQVGSSVELSVTAGGRTIQNVPGGVTLTVPAANTTPGTVAVLIHEDGAREVVRKSVADNGTVTIPLDGSAKLEIVDNSKQFADVPATSWAADAVAFASSHELFNGASFTQFSPEQPMSRGMLAVVLHNLEGNPAQTLTGAFVDVDNSQWYAKGVAWAEAQGIIGGYGNGQFGPNDNITREQLAVMLWRYAGSPAATDRELHFADAHRASDWALEALRWATENGIINGKGGGILDPTGQATRAETAQMLCNFLR